MKTLSIVLVLALVGAAGTAAAAATTSSSAAVIGCDDINGVKVLVSCVVQCVGNMVSGEFCHSQAGVAAVGPKETVDCVATGVKNILAGVTPMPCDVSIEAAGPDVEETINCVKYAVGGIVGGHPQPCPI